MSRSLGVFAAGVVLATIVELGACQSSPDTQPTSGSSTGSSSSSSGGGGASFGSSPCGACLQMACSNEEAACDAEPSCSAYLACFLACPVGADGNVDAACEGSCPAVSGSAAQSAKDAFSYCRQAGNGGTCAQQCGLASPDGGAPETCDKNPILTQQCSPSNEPNPCNKCQFEKCCDSVDAVFNGGPATDLANCWLACKDSACEKACFDKYPDGVAGFGGYTACVAVNCQIPGLCKTSSACRLCQISDCCDDLADCDTDTECFLLDQCVGGCDNTDLACGSACYAAHPKGQAAYARLGVCTAQKCLDKCKL